LPESTRRIDRVWLRHWGLTRDPFSELAPPYVPLPSHDEALARLVYSIERAQRFTTFVAEAGLGKTTVLRQAIRMTRSPRRRTVLAHSTSDGQELLGLFADGLGLPFSTGSDRAGIWRALARSLRAATLEGTHVVLAIDGWDEELSPAAVHDLLALMDVNSPKAQNISLICVGRGHSDDRSGPSDEWSLAIGLERLTRSEAETYIEAKLSVVAGAEGIFTPRALTRLHSWTEGIPRRIDQLATFSLMAGALQGLEVVSPDVVDAVALRNLVEVNPLRIEG
jgi:type II secretory pathway predicted ATPase ExeA